MAKLAGYTHVTDPEHGTHVFGPDDEVPAWAEKHITNPKAWADPPIAVDPDAPPAYDQWKVDKLRDEVSTRNKDRPDDQQIQVAAPGNKAELVAALQADDQAQAAAGE